MKNTLQSGFTMIELIVVIVILGILAATALPKFIDLSVDAKKAAIAGVAGAATSAMQLNYAGCLVDRNDATKCRKINDCNQVGQLMQGGLDPKYTVGSFSQNLFGSTYPDCTLTSVDDNTITAKFTATWTWW